MNKKQLKELIKNMNYNNAAVIVDNLNYINTNVVYQYDNYKILYIRIDNDKWGNPNYIISVGKKGISYNDFIVKSIQSYNMIDDIERILNNYRLEF